MKLSEQEHERILQEEQVRLQFREEMQRKQRPRRIVLAVLWAAILAILACANPYVHNISLSR